MQFVFKLIFVLKIPCLADAPKYLCPLLVSYLLGQNRIWKGGHLGDMGTLTVILITALILKHLAATHLKKSAITGKHSSRQYDPVSPKSIQLPESYCGQSLKVTKIMCGCFQMPACLYHTVDCIPAPF